MESGATPPPSPGPLWRPFASLSIPEAGFVLDRWTGYPPAPVAVTCAPGKTSFALVGVGRPEEFYWSAFRETGESFDEGWERTLEEAQSLAVEAQESWSHCREPRTVRHCAACIRHAKTG